MTAHRLALWGLALLLCLLAFTSGLFREFLEAVLRGLEAFNAWR